MGAVIIVLWILGFTVLLLIAAVVFLYKRSERQADEIVNMKYIKVEKQPDGGWTIKTRDGKSIFEL